MKREVRLQAINKSYSCLLMCLILVFIPAVLLLQSCAGRSIKNTQDLNKILSETEAPNDPNLIDAKLCNYAMSYAKSKSYSSPACFYTNSAGEIKAMPGGAISLSVEPGTAIGSLVIMMVNAGNKSIAIGNRMLNKGEVAIYDLQTGAIQMTGIVLQPTQ